MNLRILSTDVPKKKKSPNTEFHENTSGGSRAVPGGQKDRRTGMTKLTVAFRNAANVHEKDNFFSGHLHNISI